MKRTLIFVGTYTQPIRFGTGELLNGRGTGIYVYELLGEQLILKDSVSSTNASYLTIDHTHRHLYATNELKEYQGQIGGAVSSFRLDRSTGSLSFLNTQAVHGADPCYVVSDKQDRFLYCANFMSGSVTVLPINSDGTLGKDCCFIQHAGRGVDSKRQQGPHAHGAFFAPDEKFLFVPDLGMDTILCYRPNFQTGQLIPVPALNISSPTPGSGPRHMTFHPSGKYFYVNMEMESSFCAYRYDQETGKSSFLQKLPTIPSDTDPVSTSTSAIRIHPSGKFLYVSNRGHDSLAIYRIDSETGMLELLTIQATGGKIPRDFDITPSGNYLVAAHQSSDDLMLFRINTQTGFLTELCRAKVPTPIGVLCCELE